MAKLRVARAFPLFLLIALAASATASAVGADAEAAPEEPLVVEVQLYDFGVQPHGIELLPGTNVAMHLVNIGKIDHNLFVGEDGAVAKYEPMVPPGGSAWLNFTMPAEGPVVYYCDVAGHRDLGMVGNLTLKGQTVVGGGAHGAGGPSVHSIVGLGVNFYAYWIGVFSFVMLFVVLAATFFLLRYGESKHWTDWKDRPAREKGTDQPVKATGTYVVLAITLVVFLVAAVQVMRVV